MYTISNKSTILEALKFIEINGAKTVVVISETNKVIGIISQGDVLRSLIRGVNVKGKIHTFVSGGRYNELVKNLGYKKNITAVGAAIDLNLL